MSTSVVYTTEFLVSNLTTKSVTLGPTSATVVREIQDVQVKPGPNEVTLLGLDPYVNVDSIRVDGRGPATITDIQTEKVPRKERFEEVCPDDSDDEISDTDSEDDFGVDKSDLEKARQKLRDAQAALASVKNAKSSAITALQFLDRYGNSMRAEQVGLTQMNDFLTLYRKQRAELSDIRQQKSVNITDLGEEVNELERKICRLEITHKKAKKAASKEARKSREKRVREKQRKARQRLQEREERRKFWTHEVLQVIVHLDGFFNLTPNSSRRNSVAGKEKDIDLQETVSLSITYVVPLGSWSPRYELNIKTPSSSGRIVYRAEFQNVSSETWTDTTVILSTSQTSFSSLDERIPLLSAWHVKLLGGSSPGNKANWESGLESKSEINAQNTRFMEKSAALEMKKARVHNYSPHPAQMRAIPEAEMVPHARRRGAAPQAQQARSLVPTSAPAPPQGSLFGTSQPPAPFGSQEASLSRGLFSASLNRTNEAVPKGDDLVEEDSGFDSQTLSGASNVLSYQESLRQDYGLTTTYDLPGHRTLTPSSVSRRHVIAELDLSAITLSHVLVPKLRPAAFLKARIKNTSLVTLLRGKAGMTVDGTFLGSITLPACAPDDFFNLSLGVDPSIVVTYAKPTVRRSTSGFFAKEDSAVFSRVCWIKNTKNTTVSISVHEQVPVSEDERLRINILEPKGLEKEGDRKKIEVSKDQWGTGTVSLGKNREVKWDIALQKGKDVKLVLEYEARIPGGQKIIGLD
ncbi:protein of unknown function (DUF4139) domain containing protein [Elaphomyces granulatus]